MGNFRKNSSF